ncbi:MAG: hypothetical protein AB2392_13000 [Neobacillus sp.]
MLAAELKGKIPSALQNSEDVLTSSVIGLFKYLSSPKYVQTVLEACVNVNGEELKFQSSIKEAEFLFWPRLECSEPDVLIKVKDEFSNDIVIGIEAKYWSDKSSNEDQSVELHERKNSQRDQLAREIEDLHKGSTLQYLDIKHVYEIKMIYLTNHTFIPREKMLESLRHVQGVDFPKDQLYWLSWREIHNVVARLKEFDTLQDQYLVTDLKWLLEKKGLQSFNGYQQDVKEVPAVNLGYRRSQNSYHWADFKHVGKLTWSYGGE